MRADGKCVSHQLPSASVVTNDGESCMTKETLQEKHQRHRSLLDGDYKYVEAHLIAAELFVLCSLSFTISVLPSIPDGSFYDYLRTWWTTQSPTTPLTENAKQIGQGVLSGIKAKDSSAVSAPSTESRDSIFRPETETIWDLINPHGAPQGGLMDEISTGKSDIIIKFDCNGIDSSYVERARNTAPLSFLARDNEFSPSRNDASSGEFGRLHIPSKRPRMDLNYVPEYSSSPHENQYLSFNFTRRHMIDKLPEPFKTGIQNSGQWKNEQEIGGLSVTNCLSLYIPEKENKDTFLVVRMGYLDGFQISHRLGIGDPETPETVE